MGVYTIELLIIIDELKSIREAALIIALQG